MYKVINSLLHGLTRILGCSDDILVCSPKVHQHQNKIFSPMSVLCTNYFHYADFNEILGGLHRDLLPLDSPTDMYQIPCHVILVPVKSRIYSAQLRHVRCDNQIALVALRLFDCRTLLCYEICVGVRCQIKYETDRNKL